MFEAAGKAFLQLFSPPFRRVMLKSIGLALLMLVVIGIGLHRLLASLAAGGANWATNAAPLVPQWGWDVFAWFLSFAIGLGLIGGAVFLMPAVTAFVGTFFVDEIGDIVERTYYPNDPAGQALSLTRALLEGLKTAVLAIIVYLSCAPLLLTGIGFIALFVANSYLLGREYFLLAAMRFHSSNEARALWRQHSMSLYIAGMVIAFVVSIPVLNFVTPIFAMAFMVHMHKRIAPSRIEIVAPQRPLLKE